MINNCTDSCSSNLNRFQTNPFSSDAYFLQNIVRLTSTILMLHRIVISTSEQKFTPCHVHCSKNNFIHKKIDEVPLSNFWSVVLLTPEWFWCKKFFFITFRNDYLLTVRSNNVISYHLLIIVEMCRLECKIITSTWFKISILWN
jgi:hypothetical protein